MDVTACFIEAYVIPTQALRDKKDDLLLISYTSPYKGVTTSSIARWLRTVMELAGIDVSTYKAHSVRSASSSKAKTKGLSAAQIMKAPRRSNDSTFYKFYYKNIADKESNLKFSDLFKPSLIFI